MLNKEKAPVGAFSVIVKTDCETDGSFYSTSNGGERLGSLMKLYEGSVDAGLGSAGPEPEKSK